MNGINYNTLLGNTGLFSQQTNTVADELKYKGTSTKEKTTDKKQTNADHDTVEINGEAGQLQKAGYDRPKCTVRQQQTSKYKQIDENGIQEGVQLSSAAKKLLKELKAKYSNMEISVAEWSSDEEQDYYASKCTKDYSVLISPEALEQMAADESVREKYEAILDGAGESSKKMQEELGDDVKKIQSFTITIDKDGKVSYAVKLIQDFAKHNEKRTEEAKKAQQAKKEEEKKKNQEYVLKQLLVETYTECKKTIKLLDNNEILSKYIVPKVDFNKTDFDNVVVTNLKNSPFKNENTILDLFKEGIFSTIHLHNYFRIKSEYQGYISIRITFFDREELTKNSRIKINKDLDLEFKYLIDE